FLNHWHDDTVLLMLAALHVRGMTLHFVEDGSGGRACQTLEQRLACLEQATNRAHDAAALLTALQKQIRLDREAAIQNKRRREEARRAAPPVPYWTQVFACTKKNAPFLTAIAVLAFLAALMANLLVIAVT